jgi:DNA-binding winged helix-turn-helix (wHTH) protein
MPTPVTYRFGSFELNTSAYQLTDAEQVLAVPPKVIDLLVLLVSQPSALVTKDAILARLWPDIAVT